VGTASPPFQKQRPVVEPLTTRRAEATPARDRRKSKRHRTLGDTGSSRGALTVTEHCRLRRRVLLHSHATPPSSSRSTYTFSFFVHPQQGVARRRGNACARCAVACGRKSLATPRRCCATPGLQARVRREAAVPGVRREVAWLSAPRAVRAPSRSRSFLPSDERLWSPYDPAVVRISFTVHHPRIAVPPDVYPSLNTKDVIGCLGSDPLKVRGEQYQCFFISLSRLSKNKWFTVTVLGKQYISYIVNIDFLQYSINSSQ
jgi:hypothetical protein